MTARTMSLVQTKTRVNAVATVALAVSGVALAAGFMFVKLAKVTPTFALSASSPSGTSVPGTIEVLRFSIINPTSTSAIDRIMFDVSTTDNAGSDWNTCGSLGQKDKWTIYNTSTGVPVTGAGGDVRFYDSSGKGCAAGADVQYASLQINPGAMVAPDSTTGVPAAEFSLYVDFTAASSIDDDTAQITISKTAKAVRWIDDNGKYHSADGITSLPVTGNTLIF